MYNTGGCTLMLAIKVTLWITASVGEWNTLPTESLINP